MSQSDIIAPILSYDDINKRAEDFLREHKRNEILPESLSLTANLTPLVTINVFLRNGLKNSVKHYTPAPSFWL